MSPSRTTRGVEVLEEPDDAVAVAEASGTWTPEIVTRQPSPSGSSAEPRTVEVTLVPLGAPTRLGSA